MNKDKVNEIRERSVEIMEGEEVGFASGHWIAVGKMKHRFFGTEMDAEGLTCVLGTETTLGEIREEIKKGKTSNADACVCGEGAVLLAAARDPELEDELHATAVLEQVVYPTYESGFLSSIPGKNDGISREIYEKDPMEAKRKVANHMRELFKLPPREGS